MLDRRAPAEPVRELPPEPAALADLQRSYRDSARFVMPSVVHITNTVVGRRGRPGINAGVGSGILVTADGYILTNAHVVEKAKLDRVELVVRTSDGREFHARIIGTDVPSDIAVIKVDDEGQFTPAKIGNSDGVEVGDLVLAIGSPFELNHTVTHGIISAVSRRLGGRSINEEFLQTDAPINPGNSGGALVNLRGEVIGINTRILSQSGTSSGIGFAIPINLARWVQERLIEKGRLDRGYLGVGVVDLDENLVRQLRGMDIDTLDELLADLGMERAEGAFVSESTPGGPAAKAGLEVGDVILEYGIKGSKLQKVRTSEDLVFLVADTPPGTAVTVTVLRDRQSFSVDAVLGARP